ncbi:MAG: VWA domain-containing protein [Planctomycetia bacterium]|nr:VWA domain-containing protein [Planctomycetia bacterium]
MTYRAATYEEPRAAVVGVAGREAKVFRLERPRDVFDRKGVARVGDAGLPEPAMAGAPFLADHNEAANSEEFLSAMPGDSRAFMGRGPGVYDAMGVGGGGGAGGRMGGRRNLAAPGGRLAPAPDPSSSAEGYTHHAEGEFALATENPLSTFSVDVDTASYANIRRFLAGGQLPPRDAVRIEEMLNYFRYDYPAAADGRPFSAHVESHAAPWSTKHRLVRIGLRAKDVDYAQAPASNLVFLVDVSGSMNGPGRLPLVKTALKMLAGKMRAQDKVSMVVYAGSSGLVLPPTSGADRAAIEAAVDRLQAGGSTNGAAGIELAYQVAAENFVKGGTNRVLLCTDGDWNVGVSSPQGLAELIAKKRETGVFLSVLGFGMGNYQDSKAQELAEKGNGNAAYIDSEEEAEKVLVRQMTGTLLTVAKDVKIQVEFNPAKVAGYRLIGYESRRLAAKDFNDDRKDAGEIGAGHQVTALYEVVPVGVDTAIGVDPLKYRQIEPAAEASDELLTVKLRFKEPEGDRSEKLEIPFVEKEIAATPDFEFATAVAMAGMLLKGSENREGSNWGLVVELAGGALGNDPGGERAEFVELARTIAKAQMK